MCNEDGQMLCELAGVCHGYHLTTTFTVDSRSFIHSNGNIWFDNGGPAQGYKKVNVNLRRLASWFAKYNFALSLHG